MNQRTMAALTMFAVFAVASVAAAGSTRDTSTLPPGTYETKITTADLNRAGLHPEDAHWETLTFRADGTWRDVWFHPRIAEQAPATGHFVVKGDTIRLVGTPDRVRWHYGNGRLTFQVIHVPDALARLVYTAHPWEKIG